IREVISENGGIISFEQYMEMALYEPGLGYYSAGARKFGKEGDFITAPELSPLFSRCVARQCKQILNALDCASILELGPGTGVMACDILLELEKSNCLPERYVMFETSADLRERQQHLLRQRIPYLAEKVNWVGTIPATPFDGIVLGNEVLDAMPVHRFMLREDNVSELCVSWDKDRFVWTTRPVNDDLHMLVNALVQSLKTDLPDGYITEINIRITPWLNTLAEKLKRGVMIFIDYGYPRHEYFHPQRSEGTLLCHYRHRTHQDPFYHPGLQDITASVDFTTVADAAVQAGLHVSGFTTQAYFLAGCGLEEIINEYHISSEIDRVELAKQARILTLPGEMGERFKVIALTKNLDIALSGFQFIDQRQRL
ncbi:MAG: SAM-dependent methyltransferase, partial [Gammaproteobacteria bacterium]|nr:SAM-dependent methyltransferase [Gammaproteobacteria bacterium]